jgi:hypothetical protein
MKKIVLLTVVTALFISLSVLGSVSLWTGGELPGGTYIGANAQVGYPIFLDMQFDISVYGKSVTLSHQIGIGGMFNSLSLSTGVGVITYDDSYSMGYWKGSFSEDSLSASFSAIATEGLNYGNAGFTIDVRTCPIGFRLNGFFNLTPPANEYSSIAGDASLGNKLRVFFGMARTYFLDHKTYYRSDSLANFMGLRFIGKNSTLECAVQEVWQEDRYGDKAYFNFVFSASVFF